MAQQQYSRQPSTASMHQLSNGLLVSGPPDPSAPSPRSFPSTASSSSRSHSGPTSKIPPTGLITSAPPPPPPIPAVHSPIIAIKRKIADKEKKQSPPGGPTSVGPEFRFAIPTAWAWAGVAAFAVGLALGALVWVLARKFAVLAAVAAMLLPAAVALGVWNLCRGRRELERFLRSLDDTALDPRNLPVGRLVKVTGLVTCGAAPLETSYQNIPRCVYASTELYEYRGWNGLPVNSKHRRFTWGLRHSENRATATWSTIGVAILIALIVITTVIF